MAGVLRGEIRWADLEPTRGHEQAGVRPVLVLSPDDFNDRSETVIGMVLTSQRPRVAYPFTLELRSLELPKRSWVKVGQVRTLSVERIGASLGRASLNDVARAVAGLNEILRA